MIHVIGGAGFIGTALSECLAEEGLPFRVYDKSLDEKNYCDVVDLDSLSALPPADVVINLAAEHRDNVQPVSAYNLVNVAGAQNVCEYCRRQSIDTIIFTSSVAVYGNVDRETGEDGVLNPFNAYGESKAGAEKVYEEWYSEDPLKRTLVVIRPAVVFGEGNRGNVYNLLKRIASKQFLMIGHGKNIKSMAYVRNVADFIAYSLSIEKGHHVFNYADKPDFNMNDLVSTVRVSLFDSKSVGPRIPKSVGLVAGLIFDIVGKLSRKALPISSLRIEKFCANSAFSTSATEVGFRPRFTIGESLERTIEYEFGDMTKENRLR